MIIHGLRKDIETNSRERIGNCVKTICEKQNVKIASAFQDSNGSRVVIQI